MKARIFQLKSLQGLKRLTECLRNIFENVFAERRAEQSRVFRSPEFLDDVRRTVVAHFIRSEQWNFRLIGQRWSASVLIEPAAWTWRTYAVRIFEYIVIGRREFLVAERRNGACPCFGQRFAAGLNGQIVCRRIGVIGIVTRGAGHLSRAGKRSVEKHLLPNLGSRTQIRRRLRHSSRKRETARQTGR